MICPKCGSQNPDAQKFCTGCGTELTAYYQQQQEFLSKQQGQFQQQQYQPSYQQDAPTTPLQDPIPNFDYQQMPNNAVQTTVPAKGMGITALVMGIIGMVFFCIPLVGPYLGILFSIVGLILGAIAVSKAKKAGMKNGVAIAGLVLSCIAVGIDFLGFFFAGSLLALVGLG